MRPPAFWNNAPDAPGVMPRVLHPLSILWRMASDKRQRRGKHERVSVPVICVGNINVGGTGKTPTVLHLQSLFNGMGVAAHVISKGYGGSVTGPLRVDEAVHTATDVGDEPLLIAAFGPCWVSKDRAAGARAAIAEGAEVLILDDGMQNPDLIKDFTLMVVDAGVGFGNERVLPAGPLRQSVTDGLLVADMVLSIGPQAEQANFAKRMKMLPTIPHVKGALQPLETGMLWQDLRAFAFAGIGRPKKFFDTLRGTGAQVLGTRSFGDHETLSPKLLRRMEIEAAQMNAQMVTTEKDAVRLPKSWRAKVITLPVRLQVEDEAALVETLSQVVGSDR